ncbi:antifreeze protein [Seohaeicola zhoushanensis]|uniref:Antifreeze protein n=1 Tax=Seohaeicola zhoushanensis TaxID=1569283 RepID=A0A8J3M5V7_9RHOB|nr:antifreeze protein [Seohaeicola zhoushanensis]GHF40961.1 hypothetical protein GCM10017056_10710 [Seohaeicola zhoushanensis]
MKRTSPYGHLFQHQIDAMASLGHAMMLMAETQAVIGFRLLGMAGVWSVTATENRRMIEEKLPAFTESLVAATLAGSRGGSPAQVLHASIKPLRKRTRQNSRRLARRGPRIPKP